jgi:regulator of protease activity HflC (stomatin/prohibitin superfamily)
VFVMLVFLMMGVRVVRQGYVYTIERFGKFSLAAEPGLHLLIPFFDRVGQKVNVMEQVLDIPGRRSSPATTRWSGSTRWCSSRCSTRARRPTRCTTSTPRSWR